MNILNQMDTGTIFEFKGSLIDKFKEEIISVRILLGPILKSLIHSANPSLETPEVAAYNCRIRMPFMGWHPPYSTQVSAEKAFAAAISTIELYFPKAQYEFLNESGIQVVMSHQNMEKII